MSAFATPPRSHRADFPFPNGIATPPTPSATASELAQRSEFDAELERLKLEQEAKVFASARDTLVAAVDSSQTLLDDVKAFSTSTWALCYPQTQPAVHAPSPSAPNGAPLRRSASVCGETPLPAFDARPTPSRSFTTTTAQVSETDGLTVLSVDPFGGRGRLLSSASSLAAGLNRETMASILLNHMGSVKSHLGDLRARVSDGSSRILITGDLNSGKSTFVNALLRRTVAPVDQQPCTEILCEISDASYNEGREEIHAVHRGSTYDKESCTTYATFGLDKLQDLVTWSAEEGDEDEAPTQSLYDMLKVYVNGSAPTSKDATDAVSLLRSNDISVSLIDAPGLNRDTLSTTALFAKQSTIDVVVFVVSAENQFTLSAQEFLWAASQEKAYVFVVVNKWDAINNKPRAERRVRDQIRKLSPGTWEGRQELVHFVDSLTALQAGSDSDETTSENPSFSHLERSLSSFVFLKRFASKLQPAQTYLRHLLHDLGVIADLNLVAAAEQSAEAGLRLDQVRPEYQRLVAVRGVVDQGIDSVEESAVNGVEQTTKDMLKRAMSHIVQGQTSADDLSVPYPGITSIWQYAADVQAALSATLGSAVKAAEDAARQSTAGAVADIREDLGGKVLPGDVRHTERVFNPDVMFARRRKATGSNPVAAQLGLGVAAPPDLHFVDLFDVERLTDAASRLVKPMGEDNAFSLVGGVGVGSLALLGTGAAGGKAFVDSMVRVCELMGSKGARKWAGTVVVVLSAGLTAYLIADLPRAIPRNVGRKLERQLNMDGSWIDGETQRLSKETRKVLRLAGWDLRERFRVAFEAAQNEQDEASNLKETSDQAQRWLEEFTARVEALGTTVEAIDLRQPFSEL